MDDCSRPKYDEGGRNAGFGIGFGVCFLEIDSIPLR